MSAILSAKFHQSSIKDPAHWTRGELDADRSWDIRLSNDQVDDLCMGLEFLRSLEIAEIDAAKFPLKCCQDLIEGIRRELISGRGFVLLRGFPVEGYGREDIARMYWGFCAHLGTGVTQNGDGGLIHYVTEGRLRPNQGTRGVGNPERVSLHVDLADVVSLLCVRQAADSPRSQLVSALTIHDVLAERAPTALERLYQGFAWDRQNEHAETELPTTGYRVPVFSQAGDVISGRYNRNWITRAANRADGLSEDEEAIFNLVDDIAQENSLTFDFRPGDVQFANNYVCWHGRESHQPAQSEDDTRVLMRIWLNLVGIRDFADEAVVRHGILRHGKLGWSAADVKAGLEGRVHPRRAEDLAPLVEAPFRDG